MQEICLVQKGPYTKAAQSLTAYKSQGIWPAKQMQYLVSPTPAELQAAYI